MRLCQVLLSSCGVGHVGGKEHGMWMNIHAMAKTKQQKRKRRRTEWKPGLSLLCHYLLSLLWVFCFVFEGSYKEKLLRTYKLSANCGL